MHFGSGYILVNTIPGEDDGEPSFGGDSSLTCGNGDAGSCNKYGAYNIRVFGSVARNSADENSDIDLLVDIEEGRTLLDLGGLWQELNEILGHHVEVFTENTLKSKVKINALREARPL